MIFNVITKLKDTYPDKWREILSDAEKDIRETRLVEKKCTSSREFLEILKYHELLVIGGIAC